MKHSFTLVAAKAVLGMTLALGSVVSPVLHHHVRIVASSSACVEDEACWDCASMGNRVCGR